MSSNNEEKSIFREGLEGFLRRHDELGTTTADYILADFLTQVLKAFDSAVQERDRWCEEGIELTSESVDESV